MRDFKIIAAVAKNGVIGSGLNIPWRISEEFKHFKQTTLGGIIVFGRRTWESLGRALPGRENVIITSSPDSVMSKAGELALAPNTSIRAFSSLKEAADFYSSDPRQMWICGGAKLYESAMPHASEIVESIVNMEPDGDVKFPEIPEYFVEKSREFPHPMFEVVRYVRRDT